MQHRHSFDGITAEERGARKCCGPNALRATFIYLLGTLGVLTFSLTLTDLPSFVSYLTKHHSFGVSPEQHLLYYGIVSCMFPLGLSVGSVVVGRLARAGFRHSRLITACLLVSGLATLSYGYATRFWAMPLLRFVAGLGFGMQTLVVIGIKTTSTDATLTFMISLLALAQGIGYALGPVVVALCEHMHYDTFVWNPLLCKAKFLGLVSGGFMLLLAPLALFYQLPAKDQPSKAEGNQGESKSADASEDQAGEKSGAATGNVAGDEEDSQPHPHYWICAILIRFAMTMSFVSIETAAIPLVKLHVPSLPKIAADLILGVFGVCIAATAVGTSAVERCLGTYRLLQCILVTMIAGWLLMMNYGQKESITVWQIISGGALIGLAYSFGLAASFSAVAKLSRSEDLERNVAWLQFTMGVARAGGPLWGASSLTLIEEMPMRVDLLPVSVIGILVVPILILFCAPRGMRHALTPPAQPDQKSEVGLAKDDNDLERNLIARGSIVSHKYESRHRTHSMRSQESLRMGRISSRSIIF